MTIELVNYERRELCELDTTTGRTRFYKGDKKREGFTGLYFNDDETFFAIYPTQKGPVMFFRGKEYELSKGQNITLEKRGR